MRLENTSCNLEPFAKPGDPRGARRFNETIKPSLKMENPPEPGKIHRESQGL